MEGLNLATGILLVFGLCVRNGLAQGQQVVVPVASTLAPVPAPSTPAPVGPVALPGPGQTPINDNGACPTVGDCAACICETASFGYPCAITDSMFNICRVGPVPLTLTTFLLCRRDRQCALDCVKNLLELNAQTRCPAGPNLAMNTCADLARVYEAEKESLNDCTLPLYFPTVASECCNPGGSQSSTSVPSSSSPVPSSSTKVPSSTTPVERCADPSVCSQCICDSIGDCGITLQVYRECRQGPVPITGTAVQCRANPQCRETCISNLVSRKMTTCNLVGAQSCVRQAQLVRAGARNCPATTQFQPLVARMETCCAPLAG